MTPTQTRAPDSRALDNLGPHLLGRTPHVPQAGDFQLEHLLQLKAALASDTPGLLPTWENPAVNATGQRFLYHAARAHHVRAKKKPPAMSRAGVWPDSESVLDQGQTGHCVGFGWADWGNTLPVDDHYANPDGHALYYAAKVIDGEPGAEDGSATRSGALAMLQRGRLAGFAWAYSISDIDFWLATHGPVVVGTQWYDGMFYPSPSGLVRPTGNVAGGHEYLILGQTAVAGLPCYAGLNSWGPRWGVNGRFAIPKSDFAKLLAGNGDACLALELP